MRETGVRDVLIDCRDHRCSHHVETNVDGGATTSGYRMSKRSSPARAAASAVRMSGRIFRRIETDESASRQIAMGQSGPCSGL
jgi:hypothetical protein